MADEQHKYNLGLSIALIIFWQILKGLQVAYWPVKLVNSL